MPLIDCHVHTFLCKHAEGSPAEYVATGTALELDGVMFTDHAPAPCGYDPRHRMALEEFQSYQEMVRDVRSAEKGIRIFYGIEADYYYGCCDFLPDWLARQDFDAVLGSVHYIGQWGFDNPDNIDVWSSADVTGVWKEYFELVGKLVETRLYDIVAHLDLPKKFGHRPPGRVECELAKPLLDRIAAVGMAIELNTSGLRRPVREIYPSIHLLAMARERGIPICFGSDAHRPSEVGAGFDKALQLALETGYTEYVVFRKRRKERVPLPGLASSAASADGGDKEHRSTAWKRVHFQP